MPDLDPLDSLVEEVRQQRLPARFLPAEVIRRRSRQRSYRQAALAGVAVLAVTGLAALALAPPPDLLPRPPAQSTSPPTHSALPSAEIPPEWLLAAEDLGPGPWDPPAASDDAEWLENGWGWGCDAGPGHRTEPYPSIQHRLDQARVYWYRADRELNELWTVDETIELYEASWGPANIADVRAAITQCSQRPTPGMDVAPVYNTIVAEGFAEDESLLVQTETYTFEGRTISPDPWYSYTAVVRTGDVVRTITYLPWRRAPVPEAEDYLRGLAQRAADRL